MGTPSGAEAAAEEVDARVHLIRLVLEEKVCAARAGRQGLAEARCLISGEKKYHMLDFSRARLLARAGATGRCITSFEI